MRRNDGEDLTRVHLWVYTRDWERIKAYFGESLGPSKAARLMLRKFLDNLEAETELNAKRPKSLTDEQSAGLFRNDKPTQ